MLNLAEYRRRPDALSDWLPWAGLVARGVVLNKDGSFQRTASFRGPDLDSSTESELVAVTARLNNALKRLGSGWAMFVEAARTPAAPYPSARFPDPLSWLVDQERRAAFDQSGELFESAYYLMLAHLPAGEGRARAGALMLDAPDRPAVDWREQLNGFVEATERFGALLDGFLPAFDWLGDVETLTYLHGTVSTQLHTVEVPQVPFHLDALLADEALTGGLATLPKDYAGIPHDVPPLGAPLPGDLGQPIVAAQGAGQAVPVPGMGGATATSAPSPQVDPEVQRRQQELEAARLSKLFTGTSVTQPAAELLASAAGEAENVAPSTTPALAATVSPAAADAHQSGQEHKLAFVSAPADRSTASTDRLEASISPYVVQAGTVIPGALVSGIRSELPAAVHRDLVAYAEALGRETGQPVEPAQLVAPMLARFMATDRGFATARRTPPARVRQAGAPQAAPGSAPGSGNA